MQVVDAALAALSEDDLKCYQGDLDRAGQFKLGEHIITSAMVDIKPEQRKLSGRCDSSQCCTVDMQWSIHSGTVTDDRVRNMVSSALLLPATV